MNVCVDTVCFAGAEHVKLYTMYPEKYVECVCSFVNNCLANIQYDADIHGDKKMYWNTTNSPNGLNMLKILNFA